MRERKFLVRNIKTHAKRVVIFLNVKELFLTKTRNGLKVWVLELKKCVVILQMIFGQTSLGKGEKNGKH